MASRKTASPAEASLPTSSTPQTPESPKSLPGIATTRYYRIRKLSGFLSEILEIEIDESVIKPKMIGKQDSPQFLMGRVEDLVLGKGKR